MWKSHVLFLVHFLLLRITFRNNPRNPVIWYIVGRIKLRTTMALSARGGATWQDKDLWLTKHSC